MGNYSNKQNLNFQQNINRFIVYGITSSFIYSLFSPPIALFIILPFILFVLNTQITISSSYFYEKKNKISIYESFALILFFASFYAIYLLLINCVGISYLYYGPDNINNLTLFLRLISAPIMEEILFRGIGLGLFKQYGRTFSIVTTSILFALLHSGIRVLLVLPSALMYGITMILTKNIIYPIIMHIIINSWIFSWSSFNVLMQLNPKIQVTEHWINTPVTIALNCGVVILTLVYLWKKPFFIKLLQICRFKNIVKSIKCNTNIYKNFFALMSVKCYICFAAILSFYNIMMAIQRFIK